MDTMASGCRTSHEIGFVSPELICDSEVMFLLVPTPLFGLLLVRVMPHFELLLVRMMPWEDFEGPAMLGFRLGVLGGEGGRVRTGAFERLLYGSSRPEGNWMWCVFTTCRDMNPGALLLMVHVENVKERNLRWK